MMTFENANYRLSTAKKRKEKKKQTNKLEYWLYHDNNKPIIFHI